MSRPVEACSCAEEWGDAATCVYHGDGTLWRRVNAVAIFRQRARSALARLGWHPEVRAGMRLKVEDGGGVGTMTPGEAVMFDALVDIAAAPASPAAQR